MRPQAIMFSMEFTPEQQQAITQTGHLVVSAGAGSGKTRVLVERYVRLLTESLDEPYNAVESLVAITFTEKAAREMRDRVRQAVEQRARSASAWERPLWEERRAAIEAARIGTIHSFCASLLRAHPVESGLDPRFAVLDEVEAGVVLSEQIEATLRAIFGEQSAMDAGQFTVLLEEIGPAELRSILAEMLRGGGSLRAIVRSMPTTIDELVQYWQARTSQLQAAARAELFADPTWSAAVQQLAELAQVALAADKIGAQVLALNALLQGDPEPDLAPIAAINLQGGSKKSWPQEGDVQLAKATLRTLRECYTARATWLSPVVDEQLEARAAAVAVALREVFQQVDIRLRQYKAENDLLDFDDLEQLARQLLERHPAVRARWQQSLRAILVDEFQDTNDDQRAIIYGLAGLGSGAALTGPELFIVGDGKQSIYRFRGADVSVFAQVERDVLANRGSRVELATSFRSHRSLVDWINQTTGSVFARSGPLRPYEFPFAALKAYRAPAPYAVCAELHLVASAGASDEQRAAEAQAVVARIAAMIKGDEQLVWGPSTGWREVTCGDIALLFQASSGFEYYEEALRAAEIPYLTTAGRGYYGRKEIQDLIHLLRVLDDPADDLALVGVLRSPLFALEDNAIMALRFGGQRTLWDGLIKSDEQTAEGIMFARETLRALYGMRSRLTVVELLRAALAATGYLATISGLRDGERRRVNVEKLVQAARLSGGRGLHTFRQYLDRLLASEVREGEAPLEAENSVRLMTVHRSKGLEFPVVVLPELGRNGPALRATWFAQAEEGLTIQLRDQAGERQRPLAMQRALAQEQLIERAERERLLYVALTRAQDFLLLSGGEAQSDGDNWLSRLLQALGYPWSAGGPPVGEFGALRVIR
jgi:ATP-dependent helicase/nuclease subunit A